MDEIGVITSLAEADAFLNSMLRVYAVATLGYFIYAGLDRLANAHSDPLPALPPHYGKDIYSSEEEDLSDKEDSCGSASTGENEADEGSNVLFPIEEADHDVNADICSAFSIYHFDHGHTDVTYILMRYDQKSKSFLYWCDINPGWDVLQTTARKFVTEHRCAALYESAEVTTETETVEQPVEGTEDSTEDSATVPQTSDEQAKALTTKVDNVYIKIGRLGAFRTPEKELPKHTSIDYKAFASMRGGSLASQPSST